MLHSENQITICWTLVEVETESTKMELFVRIEQLSLQLS